MDIRILVDEFATPDRESKIIGMSRGLGGSAANVAVGVVRLGGKARVVGKIGMDNFGRLAVEELLMKKVDISGVKIDLLGETGFSIVLINQHGEVIFYGRKGSTEKLRMEEINENMCENVDFFHIASLGKELAEEIAKIAKKHNITISYDPGRTVIKEGYSKLSKILRHIDILLVNEKEALSLTNTTSIEDALEFIKRKINCDTIIKLGSKGAYVIQGKEVTHIKPYRVKAIDTTGAGDAFAAGLIIRYSETKDLVEAAKYGNAVAALKSTEIRSTRNTNKERSGRIPEKTWYITIIIYFQKRIKIFSNQIL